MTIVANIGQLGPLKRKAKKAGWDHMIRSSQDELAVLQGCYYDAAAAERVVRFFPTFLRHFEGEFAGKPFRLLEWQECQIIRPLYGWKRENGTRRYRVASIWIPKKNGKTAIASGIGLYGLIGDNEPGANVYSAACKRDQAAIMFRNVRLMTQHSPKLAANLEIIESRSRINFPARDSYYQALSSDSGSNEGLNASTLVCDEIHAWNTEKGQRLWDALKFAGRTRRQPLTVIISTAGESMESLGYEQYERARRVRDCEVENTNLLPVIYELTAEDDYTDESTWAKANPSLGITVQIDTLREEVQEARDNPKAEAACQRYCFNMWIGPGGRFIPLDAWRDCGGEIDQDMLYELPCCAGLDLAQIDDSAAWVLCFAGNGLYYLKAHYFLPEYGIKQKEKQDNVRYRLWADQGIYTLTPPPDRAIDLQYIEERMLQDMEMYDIRRVGYDPYRAKTLMKRIEANKPNGVELVEVRQNRLTMSQPTADFKRSVLNCEIRHGDCPALRWNAGNAIVTIDYAENILFDKANSHGKIDGLVAAVMGYKHVQQVKDEPRKSIYETRGFIE